MTQTGRKRSLSKLEEKQAVLAAEIKELKRQERKERTALEKERYSIMGRALAKELAHNPTLADQLEPVLDRRVTNARERKIVGLQPLSSQTPSAGQ